MTKPLELVHLLKASGVQALDTLVELAKEVVGEDNVDVAKGHGASSHPNLSLQLVIVVEDRTRPVVEVCQVGVVAPPAWVLVPNSHDELWLSPVQDLTNRPEPEDGTDHHV